MSSGTPFGGTRTVLIDEYEFVVQPRLGGHGPTLFAGLSKRDEVRTDVRFVGD